MHNDDTDSLRAAIAALEAQRATLGDTVLEVAAAPLRARLAALHGPSGLQHRQVTVLFADVVGSTAMAGALDAEDTLDVLNGAMRRMAALVEAHRGRVLRFTGNGVKAAFGMDEAREDDPERAVRAGLALLQAGARCAAHQPRHLQPCAFAVRHHPPGDVAAYVHAAAGCAGAQAEAAPHSASWCSGTECQVARTARTAAASSRSSRRSCKRQ